MTDHFTRLCQRKESPRKYQGSRITKRKDTLRDADSHTRRKYPRTSRFSVEIPSADIRTELNWDTKTLADDELDSDLMAVNTVTELNWDTKTLVEDGLDSDLMAVSTVTESEKLPGKDPILWCAFCRWGGEEIGPRKRNHIYARIDNLRKHIRSQHLRARAPDEIIPCPCKHCSAVLGGPMH
jgi:hypothetical protein